jgi:hypothetical protein
MHFPEAIIKYITESELKDLTSDSLFLLVNIFDEQSVKYANSEFIKKITTIMEFVTEEAMVDALISLLVIICPFKEKENASENIILDHFVDKYDFYNEKLLYLANRGSMFRLDAIM